MLVRVNILPAEVLIYVIYIQGLERLVDAHLNDVESVHANSTKLEAAIHVVQQFMCTIKPADAASELQADMQCIF